MIPNSFFYGGDRNLLGADYGGGFGARLTPEDEAALAQAARDAATIRLGRSGRRGGVDATLFGGAATNDLERMLFPTEPGVPSPLMIPTQPAAPMSAPMAAPMNAPALPSGLLPNQFSGGLPFGAPIPPMQTPAMAQPTQQQELPPQSQPTAGTLPGYGPQPQAGGIGDWLRNNSNMLMGLGAGIAGGRDWGQGVSMGLQGAMAGRKADSTQSTQQAVYQAIYRATGDHNKALLAAQDPEARKFVMEQIYGPKKPFSNIEFGNTKLPMVANPDGTFSLAIPGGLGAGGGAPSGNDLINYLQSLDAEGKRKNAAAEATGKVQGEAAAVLPTTLAKTDETLALIETLRTHPGRDLATGPAAIAPAIPGTKQADYIALHKQATGQTFLQAFQSLKGAGAITEKEGEKATEAIARLDRAQSREGYETALNDLRDMLRSARSRAGVIAGGKATPAAPMSETPWTQVAPGVRIRQR